jgi:hypothetical protein
VRTNNASTFTSNQRFSDSTLLEFGSDGDSELYHSGSNLQLNLKNNDNFYILSNGSGLNGFTFSSLNGSFSAAGNVSATNFNLNGTLITDYIAGAVNAARPTMFYLTERRPSGSDSLFTVLPGTWGKRLLVGLGVKTITEASVSDNVVTLPAGTYTFTAFACTETTNNRDIQTRLRDTTNNVTLAASNAFSNDGESLLNGNPQCHLTGAFVLAAPATVELQQYVNGDRNLTGGEAVGSGDLEIYAALTIIKLA